MTVQSIDAAVQRAVTVDVSIERAFDVFTSGFNRWWPRSHHIGSAEMAEAVIEPREGGRWFERGIDGSECVWGTVLQWDPPNGLSLSWAINPHFEPEPDAARASTLEIRFTAEGPSRTRVELEHRDLDRHGEDWPALRDAISGEGGWTDLLARYAEAVAETA